MEIVFTLSLTVLAITVVFGIIFTKRKTRMNYTISQHLGSNKITAALFGTICVIVAMLLLLRAWAELNDGSVIGLMTQILWYPLILFAICLAGVGLFPYSPNEKRLSSRVHQQIIQVQFLAMVIICVLPITMWIMGVVDWLLALLSAIALTVNLVFGILYMTRREILKPYVLIWESVCLALFFVVILLFY